MFFRKKATGWNSSGAKKPLRETPRGWRSPAVLTLEVPPPFARNNVARGQARIRFARCALVLRV